MESSMKLPIEQGFKLRIRSYFSFSRSPYSLPVPCSPCPWSQFLLLVTPNEIESVVVPCCPLARITGWLPNTGFNKHSSKNSISSADQIRSLTSNRNIHLRRFNDLRKYLYEQVVDTVWPFNAGQENGKSPVGTSQMVTSTAKAVTA